RQQRQQRQQQVAPPDDDDQRPPQKPSPTPRRRSRIRLFPAGLGYTPTFWPVGPPLAGLLPTAPRSPLPGGRPPPGSSLPNPHPPPVPPSGRRPAPRVLHAQPAPPR